MSTPTRLSASFRDPNGFVYQGQGGLYRQVNKIYEDDYRALMDSGLYEDLTGGGLLVSHEEADLSLAAAPGAYKVLRPELVPFISYPYEWSFSQLKDAALTTLKIQQAALKHGMSLKDASAFNLQFVGCRPLFIDSLSFERQKKGAPWIAYRQFCEHFLSPLALASLRDVRLTQLLRLHPDGTPLDLAAGLLPTRSKLSFGLFSHIHLHAKSQKHYAGKKVQPAKGKISDNALAGLIDSLRRAVASLSYQPAGTEWAEYYDDTNYSQDSAAHKAELLEEYLRRVEPEQVWDLGANVGRYSRLAAGQGAYTVAMDIDPAAVERSYLEGKAKKETGLLPLVMDLTNPSPGLGWANQERDSLEQRGPCDLALALALVHHLAISHNLPLEMIAKYLAGLCRSLVIEWVPKDDSQVQRLLSSREDIFPDYRRQAFEQAFASYFKIQAQESIKDSRRVLYLMETLDTP